jgi:hypothetical protein
VHGQRVLRPAKKSMRLGMRQRGTHHNKQQTKNECTTADTSH